MRVVVFGNKVYPEKLSRISSIFNALSICGCDIYVWRKYYKYLSSVFSKLPDIKGVIDDDNFDADIALSIGGDGTYLRTAHHVGEKNIPIVGINTGRLGFLADIECGELSALLENYKNNELNISELSLLQLSVDGKLFSDYPYALNEIAILKSDSSSMICVHTMINGEYLHAYQSDGLIVSTPTGSTAYSMSAGGPIVMPDCNNILLVAVAPHNLTSRPIVLNDKTVIDMEIESRKKTFYACLDGKTYKLPCSSKLNIRLADFRIKAFRKKNYKFINTLQQKFLWGIDPREEVKK